MYLNLKIEIFKRGLRQNNLARAVGLNEAILSKIINGYREPSGCQRQILAEYLQVEENWLFEKFEVTANTRSSNPRQRQEENAGDS